MIGLSVKHNFYTIGQEDFFLSFFYTAHFNLSNEKEWGEEFPLTMNNLYNGKLRISDVDKAKQELIKMKEKFEKLSPKNVVWDINDLSKSPPWGDNISNRINSLSNYFVTSDGKNLFDVIFEALDYALQIQWDVVVINMFQHSSQQIKADQEI